MTNSHNSQSNYINPRVLKLNVGYILSEGSGFSRTVAIDIPERIQLAEDLVIDQLFGDLRLTRTREGILLQGDLECTRVSACNRCLKEVEVTTLLELEELFASREHPDSGDFQIGEDAALDLAPLLREETLLNTPIQILCDTACKGLCKHCGHDLNEGPCDCDIEDVDPRWAALQALQKRLTGDE